jgi:hypothetical protein
MLTIVALAGGCARPQPAPRIEPFNDIAVEPASSAPPSVTASAGPQDLGSAPGDLRALNWATVPYPGGFCGVDRLVRPEDDGTLLESSLYGSVDFGTDATPVYGDIDGDGRVEAALGVGCSNGGGMASGQLGFAAVVYAGRNGRLVVIGTVVPKQHLPDEHVSFFSTVEVQPGRVVAHEQWYRTSDPTCCASGLAETIWTLQDGVLVAGYPKILA